MPGLNIVAQRRVSLSEFAEGWGDCYLIVRAANRDKVREWKSQFNDNMPDEQAEELLRKAASEIIVGGLVMSTDDNGTSSPVEVTSEDVPTVVNALNLAWLNEVVGVSSGADRLKVMMTS